MSEIYAPVSGTISAVNDELARSPELINSDPYGAGWICEITTGDGGGFADLLDAAGVPRPDQRVAPDGVGKLL